MASNAFKTKPPQLQAPIRNANRIGVAVLSHSGEFAPSVTDLRWPGRGIDAKVVRSYRSALADTTGLLGRGWFAGIGLRVEADGDDLVYHDGTGATHRFVADDGGVYRSPAGFYGVLHEKGDRAVIRRTGGRSSHFDAVAAGGRALRLEDRNQNSIEFAYDRDRIVIVDALGRQVDVLVEDDLIREVRDSAERTWCYRYDDHDRLVEVTHPATTEYPAGTTSSYGYDAEHRLRSVTDAKGQTYLVNAYDEFGRVVSQEHGEGVHRFEYEDIGRRRAVRTTWQRRNGSTVVLEHNDLGNVLSRTLEVRADLMSPHDTEGASDGRLTLVTTSAYNRHGELVRRTFPAGNSIEWTYSEDDDDPRNQGNLVRVAQLPQAGVDADQPTTVTSYERDPTFQVTTSVTDPRGNTTTHRYDDRGNRVATAYPPVSIQPVSDVLPRPAPVRRSYEMTFAYNSRGQLLRQTHIDGTVTRYDYHPVEDPGGGHGSSPATSDPDRLCGYLARVTRDADGARVVTEYAYDHYGNLARVIDGTGNATQLRYNAMGALERVVCREPSCSTMHYRYDENYTRVESSQTFDRVELDDAGTPAPIASTTLREYKDHDAVGNVVRRTIVGGNTTTTEHVARDGDGRVVRLIQPSGNTTEYLYDERGLLIEKVFAAGTAHSFSHRYTYTRNGAVRSRIDGNGGITTHRYDGFHRYIGHDGPTGTRRTQQFDAAGNVVRVVMDGAGSLPTKRRINRKLPPSLPEARYHYDEWNRLHRIDHTWVDERGRPLGSTSWDGQEGISSVIVEYSENGRDARLWTESANVIDVDRDGLGRIVRVHDTTGDEAALEYDANGNPRSLVQRDGGDGSTRTLRASHDGTDRLEVFRADDADPTRFEYNAFGALTHYLGPLGVEVHHARDARGRYTGHTFAISDPLGDGEVRIARRFEYDGEDRLSSFTDAGVSRTTYQYDLLGRQIGVVYPDGTTSRGDYDANGNLVRSTDPNGTEIVNRYDAANRLIERQSPGPDRGEAAVERYKYDAAGRLAAATGPQGSVRRTYDSLSRVVAEDQNGRLLRASYDVAGNMTELVYPGGEVIRRRFDPRGRVVAVDNGDGEPIASFQYGSGGQVTGMRLGETIEATWAYDARRRLESIEYRRSDDAGLVEGFRYGYDDRGRIVHEIQLSLGESYGSRFVLDDGNRVVREQSGVVDVFNPASPFDVESTYAYVPDGPWRRRTDVDGQGRLLNDRIAILDRRNRYSRVGDTVFEYDANGNCIRRGTDNPGICLFIYDAANRLIKSECVDAQGRRTQTIEYFYDAFGRLVRKVVTDQDGTSTEVEYAWAGQALIEEYENADLVRTYVHGIGGRPVRLVVDRNGRTDYTYLYNGRGLASGLLEAHRIEFAEKYGYEMIGAAFVTEIDGVPVGLKSRDATVSGLMNSILSGNVFDGRAGSLLRDWQNGTLTGPGGRHLNPITGAMLNDLLALTGVRHKGVKQTMAEQVSGFLGMLRTTGSGGEWPGLPGKATSAPPDMPFAPDDSLYSMDNGKLTEDDVPPEAPGMDPSELAPWPGDSGTDSGSGSGTTSSPGTSSSSSSSSSTSSSSSSSTSSDSGSKGDAPLADLSPPPLVQADGTSVTPSDNTTIGANTATSGIGGSGTPAAPPPATPADNLGNSVINRWVSENPWKAAGIGLAIQAITLSTGGPPKMSDPDASPLTAIVVTPEQIEARLNGRKKPVNPNGGVDGGGQLDGASPPPQTGGIDPTMALFDPDFIPELSTTATELKLSTAPIDYVEGYGPGSENAPPMSGDGGSIPNEERP